jgi:flagellar motor switch protein FliN/FliY
MATDRPVETREEPMTTDAPAASTPVDAARSNPNGLGPERAGARSMDLLHNVEMVVTVELGRTRMMLGDLLALHPGSVIELDRTTSSPVDILVNGTLLARGEVVVIADDLAVRITEVIGRADDQNH